MNLVDPGDTVISCHWGFFGSRLNDFAHRVGANVVELTADFGQIVSVDRIMETLAANPDTKIVSVVHAETSTGAEFPLQELAEAMRASGSDALLYVDCVTSLGGQQVEADAWGIDYGYSCSQKSLGCPPGIAPVTVSERAVGAMQRHQGTGALLLRLRGALEVLDRPADHLPPHDADPAVLRAVHGHPARPRGGPRGPVGAQRRRRALLPGRDPLARVTSCSPTPTTSSWSSPAIKVPEGIDGKEIQTRILREHGIEVGGGLGPKAPPIWRVGPDGREREPRDRRSRARRVRRRAAALEPEPSPGT